jgi:4-amino-4-deoxy-L-arabinose transferase-like glycosyltransferase
MKHPFRILRTSLAILSLLLCFAILVVWIRSYFTADVFHQYTTRDIQNRSYRPIVSVEIGKGGIGFTRILWSAPIGSLTAGTPSEPLNHWKEAPIYPDFRDFRFRPNAAPFLGFKFKRFAASLPNGSTASIFAIILPLWSLWLFFLMLALPELLYRYRLSRGRKPGLCPHCGYDLRASPDACPECGQPKPIPIGQTINPITR